MHRIYILILLQKDLIFLGNSLFKRNLNSFEKDNSAVGISIDNVPTIKLLIINVIIVFPEIPWVTYHVIIKEAVDIQK